MLMVITAPSTGDLTQLQPPPPPGPPQPVVTHGSLGRATVRHYIRLHLPAIRFCYVQELGKHPNLTQKVAVRFSIEPTGHVTGCSAAGATALDRCVARTMGQLRFPTVYNVVQGGQQVLSNQPTAVTYRFNFRPAKRSPSGPYSHVARHRPQPPGAAPHRSGPPLPPSATSPRPMGSPTARSASSRPSVTAPASRPAATSQPRRSGPGVPRKPTIETQPSDDPLGGLDLSQRRR
jgi:hypothetical protein